MSPRRPRGRSSAMYPRRLCKPQNFQNKAKLAPSLEVFFLPALRLRAPIEPSHRLTMIVRSPWEASVGKSSNEKTNPLYRGISCIFRGRRGFPALIRPSRFSHRSHRENRAVHLLSPAREGTPKESARKIAKTNPLNARFPWAFRSNPPSTSGEGVRG